MDAFKIKLKEDPFIFWIKTLFKIIIKYKYFHVEEWT
jgi:hypothetical protein